MDIVRNGKGRPEPQAPQSRGGSLVAPLKSFLTQRMAPQVALLCPIDNLTDETLVDTYLELLKEDSGVKEEALSAHREMLDVPIDNDDKTLSTSGNLADGGMVSLREVSV